LWLFVNPGMQRVLLISGSTRAASTNSALCRTAVVCAPPGVAVERARIAATIQAVLDGQHPAA